MVWLKLVFSVFVKTEIRRLASASSDCSGLKNLVCVLFRDVIRVTVPKVLSIYYWSVAT